MRPPGFMGSSVENFNTRSSFGRKGLDARARRNNVAGLESGRAAATQFRIAGLEPEMNG
jgi:hypothetical protein